MLPWLSKGLQVWGEAGRVAGLGKGSFPLPSSEVTHVVMEQTSAAEAVRWQDSRPAPPPGCAHPALLDISWFTESMAAGQPVPVEGRHCLQVSRAED